MPAVSIASPGQPNASNVKALAPKADPYSKLMHSSPAVRVKASVDLISDIYRNHQHDQEIAQKNNTTVTLAPNGLSLHLDYILGRLINGLATIDPFARIGFTTALTMVMQHFPVDTLSHSALERKIIDAQAASSDMAPSELKAFDVGRLFIAQSLQQAGRLEFVSEQLLDIILTSARRLLQQTSTFEVCVETLIVLAENTPKSSQHYSSILNTLIAAIPPIAQQEDTSKKRSKKNKAAAALLDKKNKSQTPQAESPTEMDDEVDADASTDIVTTPEDVVDAASLRCNFINWKPATIAAALCLRRLGQEQAYAEACPGLLVEEDTWQPIFNFLSRTFIRYPIVPSVWKHIFQTLLSLPDITALERFWTRCVIPGLSSQRGYQKKAIAIDLVITILGLLYNATTATIPQAQMDRLVSTVVSPHIVKLMIIHCRAQDTPLHTEAMRLAAVLEQLGEKHSSLITVIVGLCITPQKGGHRLFDTKSGLKLVATLIQKLQPNELVVYTQDTIAKFYNATQLATTDIRFAAELTKAQQDEAAQIRAAAGEKANAQDEEKETDDGFGIITDVDEFLQTPVAQQAITDASNAIRSWVIDHIYHLASILLGLKKTQQKQLKTAAVDETTTATSETIDAISTTLEKCITVLYTQAFFAPSSAPAVEEQPKKRSRSKKAAAAAATPVVAAHVVVETSLATRNLASSRYTSLLSVLLMSDRHYTQHSPTSPYFGSNEARWAQFVVTLDTQLRSAGLTPTQEQIVECAESAQETLALVKEFSQVLAKQPIADESNSKLPSIHKKTLDVVTMVGYLTSISFALAPTDISIISGLIGDYLPIVQRIKAEYETQVGPAKKRKAAAAADDDETPWVEVVIDILLSLVGLGRTILRHVAFRAFKVIIPHLTMDSIHDLVSALVKSNDEEEEEGEEEMDDEVVDKSANKKRRNRRDAADDDSDDDLVTFSDASDDEEEEEELNEEDFGTIFQDIAQIAKDAQNSKATDNAEDNDEDDDDDDDTQEIDESGIYDLLIGNPTKYIPKEEEHAIAQIVKLQKEQHRQQKDKIQQQMVMKLRILDFVQIIAEELPWTNAWLSLLLPAAVLITSSHSLALAPLHKRVVQLFQKQLCNVTHAPIVNALASPVTAKPLWEQLDLESSSQELVPQNRCSVDHLKQVIMAIFESISASSAPEDPETKKSKQQDKSITDKGSVAAKSLVATSSLLLVLPISLAEQDDARAALAPAAAPAKKTKSKKASAAAVDVSIDAIQRYVYRSRLSLVINSLQPILERSFQKKNAFSPSFFSILFQNEAFGCFLWGLPSALAEEPETILLNTLRDNMGCAITPFLRKEAAQAVSSVIKHFKVLSSQFAPASIVAILKGVYDKALALLAQPPLPRQRAKQQAVVLQQLKSAAQQYSGVSTRCFSIIRFLEQKYSLSPVELAPVKKTTAASTLASSKPNQDAEQVEKKEKPEAKKRRKRRRGGRGKKSADTAADAEEEANDSDAEQSD